MLYSFSKGKRFETIRSNCSGDYHMPNLSDKRSTSFGIGSKNKLSASTLSIPGPSHYDVKTDITINRRSKQRGITFGSSREVKNA